MGFLTKNIYWVLAIMIFGSIIYIVITDKIADNALKNATTVIGKVEDVTGGRGPFTVDVKFTYKGKIIESDFSTYNIKGMNDSVKVQLLVSKDYPDKYIKFVKIVK